MNDLVYCPNPSCGYAFLKPTGPPVQPDSVGGFRVQCHSCKLKFCAECKEPWHHTITCEEAKKLHKSSHDDLFDQWALNNKVKNCPKCKMVIEKNRGCNAMQCSSCKCRFCWYCGKEFENERLHFLS